MVNLTDPVEIAHDWGGDLQLSTTGDLGAVSLVERSKQRVIRRLMTNPGDYIFHPDYGAGLGRLVGQNVDLAKATALITGQMLLEDSVSQSPAPTVKVTSIPQGMAVQINYTTAPEKVPAVLSFSLSE